MVQTFINFILETNIISAICLCLGFAILALGIISPIVNIIINILWSIIDDAKVNWSLKVVNTVGLLIYKVFGTPKQLVVVASEGSYYVQDPSDGEYLYSTSNCWQSYASYNCRFTYKTQAEARIKEYNKPDTIVTYIAGLGGVVVTLAVLAVSFNYFFWPTIYVASACGAVIVLRSLRRLQKKAIQLASDFKAHTELKASEAHKENEA